MATLADEIRSVLKFATGPLSGAEIFAKCASASSVDQISIALSAFVKRGEAQRQEVVGQRGGSFIINPSFVPGRQSSESAEGGRIVAGKSGMAGAARAAKHQAAEEPKAAKKTKKKRGPNKAAKRSKKANPLPRISKKSKRKIRKVLRHAAPPQALPETPAQDPGPTATFGIRDDGALGIDIEVEGRSSNVRLPRLEVQRLRDFLETTSPLWS